MELKSGLIEVQRAEKECDVYCPICRKVLHLEAGHVIHPLLRKAYAGNVINI